MKKKDIKFLRKGDRHYVDKAVTSPEMKEGYKTAKEANVGIDYEIVKRNGVEMIRMERG